MTYERPLPDPEARRRSSRTDVNSRLSSYPRSWIQGAIDLDRLAPDAQSVELVAVQGEDFEGTPTQFIQDLHRLARTASHRAYVENSDTGYIVRTKTRDLPEGHVAFQFFVVPIMEASLPRTKYGKVQGEKTRLARLAQTLTQEGLPSALLAAYDHHRTYAWFCPNHAADTAPHVRGFVSACKTCNTTTAQTLPEEPDAAFIAAYREANPTS